MNWSSIFGSSSSKEKYVPALNALEQQRLKQIESLRTFHPSVTEIRKDIEYKITIFILKDELNLHVFLPPNFPNEIPVVTVSPPVNHPWVNSQMVVIGCDSLNKFYMHSNLGRALQDVCKQFLDNPPLFCHHGNATPSSSSDSRVAAGPSFSETLLLQTTDQSSQSHVSQELEGFSKVSHQLDRYSIEELKEIDSNPEKIMEIILDVELIHSKTRDDQMAKIGKIARENLEQRKPRLEAARERLVAKYEELSVVREEFDQWSLKQNDLFEMRTPEQIYTAIQLGLAQTEEESENIAEEFLHENIQVEDFIKNFTEKRKLTHIRRWKEENVLKL